MQGHCLSRRLTVVVAMTARESAKWRRRTLLAAPLAALLVAGCGTSATAPPTSTIGTTSIAEPCQAAQLTVGGLGSSGAAGTEVTTVRIGNDSPLACRLSGYPMLTFLDHTGAAITTTTGHSGAGVAFRAPSPVVLAAHTSAAAGFVVTSGDFPSGSEMVCPAATVLHVTLPRIAGRFTVDLTVLPSGLRLCRPGSPVDVSSIVPAPELDSYAAELSDALPTCDDISLGLGPALGGETGEHAVSVVLTNRASRTCELAGYPTAALLGADGHTIPFTWVAEHSQYVTSKPPGRVVLTSQASAYVLVAKYRCDLGDLTLARVLRLQLPGEPRWLTLALPTGRGALRLNYCVGGATSPGNTVSTSPIASSASELTP